MATRRVAVIEGEDASPEAVRPTVELIDGLGLDIEWLYPPVGDRGQDLHGSIFPEEAKAVIDASDTTLFGATSGKSALALFYLRWGKATFANVRPAKWRPGFKSPLARPEGIDLVIVRENLEDMYLMVEGEVEELGPANLFSPILQKPVAEAGPGRFAVKVITREGTERAARFAFELARHRKDRGRPGRVTMAAKYNMLPRSDGFFKEVTDQVADDYPDVGYEAMIVDNFAHHLNVSPQSLDVVLLPNLYGDILSDAAAGLVGGLGLAPSGCYGRDYAYFESAHGTAPDIAGQNRINPTATILSAAMMLEYLDYPEEARRLETALAEVYAEGRCLTPDQGGRASTTDFTRAVAERL
ncbi:MAG: isocitrate/isopropylmalate dehydrogenase family protein [Proteobacteria bacterium]|nr:isocitrate/isopropylmalate dehydrogenase family protein [Pseudomonadota bacterium]